MQTAQDALSEAAELLQQREYARAEEVVQRRLTENPHDSDALHLLGVLARNTGRLNFSAEVLRQAVRLNDSVAAYHFDLALTVNRLDQIETALVHFRRAAELKPDYQDAAVNVGTLLHRLDRLEEAKQWFQRAVQLDPHCAIARYNLGNIWHALGQLDDAKHWYASAMELEPKFAKAHWNKALCHLLAGEFADGWREFAWRRAAGEVTIDNYPQPLWQGEPLAKKTILVHAEQGVGDEILFGTCLPDLIVRAGRCIVVCEPRLAPLFARSFSQARVVGHARRKDRAPAVVDEPVDFQAPFGDLPRWLRPNSDSFPDRSSYLLADEARVAQWRERFAAIGPGLKIGISWQAGGQPHERRKRSTILADWLPVFAVPGCHFINVQYGECADEIAIARQKLGIEICEFAEGDPLVDLDDFAAKIAALDLVISVGNTTVHLAGALGVPVWALLPTVPAWRWLIEGERNPWYTSVRAIRQTTTGDWRPVFAAAAQRLQDQICNLQFAICNEPANEQATPLQATTLPNESDDPGAARLAAPTRNIQKIRERALACFRAGDMEAAEKLFSDVLAHSPRDLRALHCMGQIAKQNGRVEMAIRTLSRAAAVGETQPAVWLDLARSQLAAGDGDAAIASYQRLVAIDPRHAEGWFELAGALRAARRFDEAYAAYCTAAPLQFSNPKVFNFLGATCLELGRVEEAERSFRRAIEIKAGYHAAWNNLGCALERQGKHDEAIACFQRVLEIDPQNSQAKCNLASLQSAALGMAELRLPAATKGAGCAGQRWPVLPPALAQRLQTAGQLYNEERFEEADTLAREVLAVAPEHPVALRIVGVAARRAGRFDESVERLTKATELDPTTHALWFELGVTYLEQYQHKEAFDCFLRCYEVRPQFQPACINLAGILEQQERYEEAIPWALKAVEQKPDCYMSHYNLANNYRELGRIREAIVHYERAVALNPDYTRADWNLGICHLHLGNYEQGWPRYENRTSVEEVKIDQFTEPRWNGEPLAGKTIVVHAEQGIGDEIVFSSCLPELIPQARRVIIVCETRLEHLFRRSFPQCRVIGYARRKNWAPCPIEQQVDYQIPMGSLPLYLRPTRESFPKRERFLIPDAGLVEQWRKRFASLGAGIKVGVSWRAGGKPLERRKRSVPLEMWAPVFEVAGAKFVNLQYGDAIDDAADVRERFGVELYDWEQGDPLVDIDHFAAKVAALDLVISVGNATVHVAGSVGTPAWSLLPMVPSWRWMVEGDTSPWYTSVRLLRQPRRNDWPPVFDRVGRMLRELAGAPAAEYRRRAMTVNAPLILDSQVDSPASRSDDEEWLDASQFCVKATIDALPDLMQQAKAHTDRGELAEAEAIYRRVLTLSPRYPSALQGLSRVARRMGKTELAIRSIKRALATAENVPERRCDLAGALADVGRYDEATESYLRAIELNPDYFPAHFAFGLMLQKMGRHDEALARFKQAAAIEPDNAAPLVARAVSLVAICRPDEAAMLLRSVVEMQPDCTAALLALAEIYCEDQADEEAEACLRRALAADPTLIAAEFRLAALLDDTKRSEEAAECYQRIIALEPDNYSAHIQLGTLYDRSGRAADAERFFRCARSKVEHPPRELVNSLGLTLADQGRLDEALACYDEALAISGDEPYPNAHANRAFALLQLGRFAEGWREYEWRWQCPGAPGRPRDQLRAPVWDGAPLTGSTILIHGEQGLGDEIMFATCYPDVIEQAAHAIIVCEPRLERLFRRSFPAATVLAVVRGMEHQWQIPPRLEVDGQIAAGSLPLHLRQSEASFPRRKSILVAEPELVARWRERFAALGPGLKIGISWRAGEKPKERQLRTTRLEQWRPLLETPGASFINLQHGDCSDEIAEIKRACGVTVHHWRDADNRNDIDGLAARMAALDLVISVGNANVHLAGALGMPTWSLLPAHGGWRWLQRRSDTPWYASVRLFRQAAANDWDVLFMRVRQELLKRLAQTAEPNSMRTLAGPHWPLAAATMTKSQ